MDMTCLRIAAACLFSGVVMQFAGCSDRSAPAVPASPAHVAPVATAAPASAAPIATTAPAPAASIASTPPASDATVPGAAPASASAVSVALDPEGLRLFVNETGASRLIAFGAAQDEVAAQLSRALPEPQQAYPEDENCGAMIQLPRSGLNVYFRDGEFAGWGIDDASRLTTVAGIGMGSTRKALEAVVVTKMFAESTLEHEFDAGGISGTFASGAKDTKINALWAGDACIMR
jgi:hypothetical protein